MPRPDLEGQNLESLELERERTARASQPGALHPASGKIDEPCAIAASERKFRPLGIRRRAVNAHFVRSCKALRTGGGENDARIVALDKRVAIAQRPGVATLKQARRRRVGFDALQQVAVKIAVPKGGDRKFKAMRAQLLRVGCLQDRKS